MDILSSTLCELKKKISSIYPASFTEINHPTDFFSVDYDKKGMHLRYSNQTTALFGLGQISASLGLSHLYAKGKYEPIHPWRVLYPSNVSLNENFFLHAIESGFNAVVLNPDQIQESNLARQWNLKIILNVSYGGPEFPFEPTFLEALQIFIQELPYFDALLWKSPYFKLDCRAHLLKHYKLQFEIHLEELQALETCGVIFYELPLTISSDLYRCLEQHAGPATFFVVSNDFKGGAHSIPLLAGFEESIPLITDSLPLSKGAFVKFSGNWEKGSYLDCHLSSIGAALWGVSSFEKNGWNWLKLHRPEIEETDDHHLIASLQKFYQKSKVLSAVKDGSTTVGFEEMKLHVDCLIGEMKLFHYNLLNWQIKHPKGFFFHEANTYIEKIKDLCQSVQRKNK